MCQNKIIPFRSIDPLKVIKETRKHTNVLDKINPKEVHVLYIATIVLVIAAVVFFILGF